MSTHVLPPLAVKSKSERKVNSMLPLGFKPVIFGMLAHLSNHSAKFHPTTYLGFLLGHGGHELQEVDPVCRLTRVHDVDKRWQMLMHGLRVTPIHLRQHLTQHVISYKGHNKLAI
jgi:hypothetical protein